MRKIKAVDLYMRSIIPDDISLEGVTYDKKGLGGLMAEVGEKHPKLYREISKKVLDMGRESSYMQGETITLQDMVPTFDKDSVIKQMRQEVKSVTSKIKNKDDQKKARAQIYAKYSEALQGMTMDSIKGTKHNLGNTVTSGSRGSPSQLMSMVTTPGIYTDYKNDIIDMFIENSYGEGLRPHEYLSSTFGTRKAVISTKEATADAGDLAKQMVQSATNIVVTEEDCGTNNGVSMSINEDNAEELSGRVVQRKYGNVPNQSIMDKQVFRALKKGGTDKLLVRSPMTCESKQGICQKCCGLNFDGKMPSIGESVGITAAQGLGEPLTQGALNVKHGGGQFSGSKVDASGFKVLNQIMQSPSTYPNKAAVAEEDGHIEAIEEAPQGGSYITIAGKKHYSLPGFEINVKKGDVVERGHRLSEGILNIKDIVRLRGLGSGRKAYADYLREVFDNSGMYASTRNLEMLARGAIDHVRMTGNESLGGYLPDDLASYNSMSSAYVPDRDTQNLVPESSVGRYLQAPALHYSIGTKVTPNMAKNMQDVNLGKVMTSASKPTFEPEMIRLRTAIQNEKDWMAALHSSYQASRLQNAATSGAETDVHDNVHFAPRLAYGKDFGDNSLTTGKF